MFISTYVKRFVVTSNVRRIDSSMSFLPMEMESIEELARELEDVAADELEEYRKAFKLFDKDNTGTMATKELGLALRSLGLNPTEYSLMELVSEADLDEYGTIEFLQFCQVVKKVYNSTDSETIRGAFRAFDRDGNGYITTREFRVFMTEVGEQFSDEEVDEIIALFDVDGDGQINYEEFVKMMEQSHKE